jgi:NADPH-dependent 2,4-dienoyl-CoA reductase/sulfur reductase-like enzyme
VIGASFIGLEVAASLRNRELDVFVVGLESLPLEKVLGRELGELVHRLHEVHGVQFRLGQTATRIEPGRVTLENGEVLDADLVVIGVGVKPRIELAERAGLNVDKGVLVDEFLETSAPGIYAAGDIAKWPNAQIGALARVEHWVHAERMGQTAARNMLFGSNARERFTDVPFFWSAHYDVTIRYTGRVDQWDDVVIIGDVSARDAAVGYRKGGRILAVATVGRDKFCLEAEEALERNDDETLARLFSEKPRI